MCISTFYSGESENCRCESERTGLEWTSSFESLYKNCVICGIDDGVKDQAVSADWTHAMAADHQSARR